MAVPAPPPVDPPPPDLLTVQARSMGLPPSLDVPLHAALTATAPTPTAEALVGLAPPPPPPASTDALAPGVLAPPPPAAASAAASAEEAPAAAAAAAPSRRWVTTARRQLVANTSFFLVPHLLTFDDGDALMNALEGGSPDLLASVATAVGLAPPPVDLQLTLPSVDGETGAAEATGATTATSPSASARPSRPAVTDIPSLLSRLGNPSLSTLDSVRVVDLRGDGLDADGVAGLRLPLLTPGVGVLDVRGNTLAVDALTALAADLPRLRVLGCEALAADDAVAVAAAAPGLEVINGVRVERRPPGAEGAADPPAAVEPPATGAAGATSSAPADTSTVPSVGSPAAAAAREPDAALSPPTATTLLAAIGPATHAYTVARPESPADTHPVWYVPSPLGACLRHAPAADANVRVGRVFWGGHARDVVWATRDIATGETLRRDYAEGVEGAAARAEVLEHFGVQD
ncbi:hypothetical protein MMPV_001134 [Pyropia vietnamensis]